jgi:hypothetical protein
MGNTVIPAGRLDRGVEEPEAADDRRVGVGQQGKGDAPALGKLA